MVTCKRPIQDQASPDQARHHPSMDRGGAPIAEELQAIDECLWTRDTSSFQAVVADR